MLRANAESIYELLTDDEDARVCTDISEEACQETPRNFVLILATHVLTKLGDALANPKTVLSWVMGVVGAPLYLLGFLVPIRESGSLIPQLLIASYIRRLGVRKWVWVAGSVLQALTVAGMGLAAATLQGAAAGWAIVALLAAFSLARGLCSIASKDVLGKTVPRRRRGQLTGWSASAAGLITMLFGLALVFGWLRPDSGAFYGWLLLLAGALWIAAAMTYSTIVEYSGATSGGGNALYEAIRRLDVLRTDVAFRRFVMTRALLLCSALTAPYFVALAQQHSASQQGTSLGLFVVAGGVASLLGAPVWGRFADRSSRRVMIVAAVLAALAGLGAFVVAVWLPEWLGRLWVLPAAYFVLSLAHSGVRVGRKTYVVDLARGDRRTDYVAVSNSVIGVVLLLTGFAGALATLISVPGVIAVLSLMGFAGAVMGLALPEAE